MLPSLIRSVAIFCISFTTFASAQSDDSGYIGYSLRERGDEDSTVYDTASTSANVSTTIPDPDVFLNASVSVGEIDIQVENLTAKINLEAQVLSLLTFNAGVDVSIDRVSLLIENVIAHVVLEARLTNLVTMISDVLDSLDLNPVLATLGSDVTSIVNTTTSALTGTTSSSSSSSNSTSSVSKRSYELTHNILYSINNYAGNTHTNRVLSQSGQLIDQSLNNDGQISSQKVVGDYTTSMSFNGYNKTVTRNGESVYEVEYTYAPFPGLMVVSAVFLDMQTGGVVGTQVLAESGAGGGSTIGN